MPSAVVTVRWLQPPRYRGMEETVSRSRVRQRGHLNVGEEVRVRYKRSYYKAEIIDIGDVPTTEPTASNSTHQAFPDSHPVTPLVSPPRLQDPQEASSPDSPPRVIGRGPPAPLPYFTPFASTPLVPTPQPRYSIDVDESTSDEASVFNPVPEFHFPRDSRLDYEDTDGVVLFPEQSDVGLLAPVFMYSIADSVPEDPFDDGLGAYDSDADSYDSDDSAVMPTFVSNQESDAAIQEHAQQMINNRSRLRHSPTNPIPASSDESHECIEEELLEDIVRSAEVSPDHEDSTLTTVQRFYIFLSGNIKRIEEELLPRVSSLAELMLDDDRPCLRCIINLTKTIRRLESQRDNLAVFLSVAERTMHTDPEE